ncbi:serine/threonine-protein kinase [Actinokineospora pegani]|uniref:serine/threonine-protein kinase n=1 Tax=Actinokineospora pegani TaxID=2654637 RepID=UPI001F38D707|nr:serine/threonine-protein kinase [Actinokineospora pegani]
MGDPERVGAYAVRSRLGQGAMGTVYLATSPGGRPVALKVVRAELAGDPEFRDRFRQEISAARAVGGFWTAAVVDADPSAPRPWLATEYVPGPTLADAIDRHGALPEAAVLRLAAGLAEALAAIHAAGLLHRDLKPSNVLLASDGPRVIDFGIAKGVRGAAADLTGTGLVVGTPGFLSPEQIEGGAVGTPSDVFALGSVLVNAATGRGPFGDTGLAATLYRIVHGQPDLEGMPTRLRAVASRCLNPRPELRPTPDDLLDEIGHPEHADWLPGPVREFVEEHRTRMLAPVPRPGTRQHTGVADSAPPADPGLWTTDRTTSAIPGDGENRGTPGRDDPGSGPFGAVSPPVDEEERRRDVERAEEVARAWGVGRGRGGAPSGVAGGGVTGAAAVSGQVPVVGPSESAAVAVPVAKAGALGEVVDAVRRWVDKPAGEDRPEQGRGAVSNAVPVVAAEVGRGEGWRRGVPPRRREFRSGRLRALWWGLVGSLGAVICLATAVSAYGGRHPSVQGPVLALAVVFGMIGLAGLWGGLRPKTVIEVDERGIAVRRPGRRERYDWREIARVEVGRGGSPWLLVWTTRDGGGRKPARAAQVAPWRGGRRRKRDVADLRAALTWYGGSLHAAKEIEPAKR